MESNLNGDVYLEHFDPKDADSIRELIETNNLKFKPSEFISERTLDYFGSGHPIYEILVHFRHDLSLIFIFLKQILQVDWIAKKLKSDVHRYELNLLFHRLSGDDDLSEETDKFRPVDEILAIMKFFQSDLDHLSLLYLHALTEFDYDNLPRGEISYVYETKNDIEVITTLITRYKDRVNYNYFLEYELCGLTGCVVSEMGYIKSVRDIILNYEGLVNYREDKKKACLKFIEEYIESDGKKIQLVEFDELIGRLY